MKKLITTGLIGASILAGNVQNGNCENSSKDELLKPITRTYILKRDFNYNINSFINRGIISIKGPEEKDFLGMKIWEVDGIYNRELADNIASAGKELRKIFPKNVFIKTSLNEVKIGVKYEIESILDFNLNY